LVRKTVRRLRFPFRSCKTNKVCTKIKNPKIINGSNCWVFKSTRQKPSEPNIPASSMPMIRFVEVEPTNQYVNSIGYVSLFPMLLDLIDPKSPNLGKVIDQLSDQKELWTKFGLRSLSKSAPLYDKRFHFFTRFSCF
jgi:hypothetical protein